MQNVRSRMHSFGFTTRFDASEEKNIMVIAETAMVGDGQLKGQLTSRELPVIPCALSYRSNHGGETRMTKHQRYCLKKMLRMVATMFPDKDVILWLDTKYASGVYNQGLGRIDDWVDHGLLAYTFSLTLVLSYGNQLGENERYGWVYLERESARLGKGMITCDSAGNLTYQEGLRLRDLEYSEAHDRIFVNVGRRVFGRASDREEVDQYINSIILWRAFRTSAGNLDGLDTALDGISGVEIYQRRCTQGRDSGKCLRVGHGRDVILTDAITKVHIFAITREGNFLAFFKNERNEVLRICYLGQFEVESNRGHIYAYHECRISNAVDRKIEAKLNRKGFARAFNVPDRFQWE